MEFRVVCSGMAIGVEEAAYEGGGVGVASQHHVDQVVQQRQQRRRRRLAAADTADHLTQYLRNHRSQFLQYEFRSVQMPKEQRQQRQRDALARLQLQRSLQQRRTLQQRQQRCDADLVILFD